jgi:hypothetical protein
VVDQRGRLDRVRDDPVYVAVIRALELDVIVEEPTKGGKKYRGEYGDGAIEVAARTLQIGDLIFYVVEALPGRLCSVHLCALFDFNFAILLSSSRSKLTSAVRFTARRH